MSTINTVICSLVDFHGAVKDEIELQWPACFPDVAYSVWVDVVVGGGRQVRMGLKESRFPRGGGGLDGNVETGVINLQMGEGALGSWVSVSCLYVLGCFVMAPTSSSPWAPGAILHSYLWASTRPLISAVPPLHRSLKVDKKLSCCRWAVCTNS